MDLSAVNLADVGFARSPCSGSGHHGSGQCEPCGSDLMDLVIVDVVIVYLADVSLENLGLDDVDLANV